MSLYVAGRLALFVHKGSRRLVTAALSSRRLPRPALTRPLCARVAAPWVEIFLAEYIRAASASNGPFRLLACVLRALICVPLCISACLDKPFEPPLAAKPRLGASSGLPPVSSASPRASHALRGAQIWRVRKRARVSPALLSLWHIFALCKAGEGRACYLDRGWNCRRRRRRSPGASRFIALSAAAAEPPPPLQPAGGGTLIGKYKYKVARSPREAAIRRKARSQ